VETELQALLRSYGEGLVALSARALPELHTDYLPAPADMSARGSVHTFRPTYTVPGPNGTRISKVAKTWAWRFHYRGKPYSGAAGYNTAKEAREAGETRKAELRAGLEDDWRKVTVGRLYEMAAARKVTWDASTGVHFEYVWKRLLRFFPAGELVQTIDDTRLLQFVAKRKAEGSAINTIKQDLGHLRGAMMIAHRKRLLPWLPEFPSLRYQRREQTVEPIELRQIIAELPERYRLFFAAAEEMGWRARSELRTRKWEHVDFGPDTWTCCSRAVTADVCACGAGRPGWVRLDAQSSKTDEPRLFPMTRRLRAILHEAKARCERVRVASGVISPWVFVKDEGGPLGNYRTAWANALRRLGIPKLEGRTGPWSSSKAVHDVRRAAIRRMKREGIDRETRRALVGHASDSAHSLYEQRTDLDAMRAAARRLDQDRAEGPESNVRQLSLFRKRG
jgi:hypothetical protein